MSKKKKTSENMIAKFFSKKKKKTRRKRLSPSWMSALKIVLVIMFLTILIAGGSVGMLYLDTHIKALAARQKPTGSLKLIDPPKWLNQEWQDALVKTAGGMRFALNETAAQKVAERLQKLSWLENVRVQTTPEFVEVRADYRRPVAVIQGAKGKKFYLDSNVRVLDYIPLSTIPIPEVAGLSSRQIPEAGLVWKAEDAAAAVELLEYINKMDLYFINEKKIKKPILFDIEGIDISNYAGRQSKSGPIIILKIKDGTQIYWGAPWGEAAVYSEADDKQKLTRLYETYINCNNSLQVNEKFKYIDLRWLEDEIPRLK